MTRHPKASRAAVYPALASLLLVLGCESMRGTVRSAFSNTYSCPRSAIVITPRPDVKAHTVIDPPSEPPADVASDPARLRLWNERRQRHYAQLDSDDDVFDASGCGHEDRYACEPGVDTDFFCRSASVQDTPVR